MTYETIATLSQVTSLLMFIAMFAAVVAYALWPGNQSTFDDIQRHALGLERGLERGLEPGDGADDAKSKERTS